MQKTMQWAWQLYRSCRLGLGAMALTAALATAALCQQTAIVFGDGAWCQTTQGQGTDEVFYRAIWTVYREDGSWSAKSNNWHMGTFNDRGGASNQELPKLDPIAAIALKPGETAEMVVGVYAFSNGGFFQKLFDSIPAVYKFLSKIVGIGTGDPLVDGIISLGVEKGAQAISNAMKAKDGFVGSVRITVWRDSDGKMGWNYKPLDSAWDKGRNPQGSYSIGMRRDRGEYWPKFGVRFIGG